MATEHTSDCLGPQDLSKRSKEQRGLEGLEGLGGLKGLEDEEPCLCSSIFGLERQRARGSEIEAGHGEGAHAMVQQAHLDGDDEVAGLRA